MGTRHCVQNRLIICSLIIIIIYPAFSGPITAQNKFAFRGEPGLSKYSEPVKLTLQHSPSVEEEKNFFIPALEVISINMGVWAYNKFLTKEGWSEIGFNTMKENLRTGFKWDNDGFLMNQFMHPYHGSQYFNAARSNGLSFWESCLYPYGGSLMWELFMENQAPSYNDLINTPVSGILIGEISYRISDLIIDESKTGFMRFLTETAALIVNPTRGINRLVKGQMWRMGEKEKSPGFTVAASIGTNSIFFDNKRENRKTYALTRLNLIYGNMMNTAEHEKPFDYFTVRSELDFTLTDNVANLIASGVIWDKHIMLFDNSKDILGIYKELDLLINTVYKFTATQITTKITSEADISETGYMRNSIFSSLIMLGGINSKYASAEGKDYNLGPGAAIGISSLIRLSSLISIETTYKKFWIHTLSGASGEEFAGYLNLSLNFHLKGQSYFGSEFTLYHRHGFYDKYSNTNQYDSAIKTYFTFMF